MAEHRAGSKGWSRDIMFAFCLYKNEWKGDDCSSRHFKMFACDQGGSLAMNEVGIGWKNGITFMLYGNPTGPPGNLRPLDDLDITCEAEKQASDAAKAVGWTTVPKDYPDFGTKSLQPEIILCPEYVHVEWPWVRCPTVYTYDLV